MKNNKILISRYLSVALMLIVAELSASSQSSMPEILLNGTLKEQMDYLTEKTRIYEDYRAIREDMFQKIRANSIDSLNTASQKIIILKNTNNGLNLKIDSLNVSLVSVQKELDQTTKAKNSIQLLGLDINKSAYNAVLFTIIIALAGILVLGFLAFKRNLSVTNRSRKDFEDLKREFEAYRKASREAREKLSMAHFYELRKIRGG